MEISRAKPVPLANLLVGLSLFPDKWDVQSEPHPMGAEDERYAEENLVISLRSLDSDTSALHEVYRYKNASKATFFFHLTNAADFFASHEKQTDWRTPPGWAYHSPIASEFQFACAVFDAFWQTPRKINLCVARARYEEFVSIFSMNQPGPNPNLQDIERILHDIDTKMANYLE